MEPFRQKGSSMASWSTFSFKSVGLILKYFYSFITLNGLGPKYIADILTEYKPKGAFTPDANEALSASDLHVKSMQRCK